MKDLPEFTKLLYLLRFTFVLINWNSSLSMPEFENSEGEAIKLLYLLQFTFVLINWNSSLSMPEFENSEGEAIKTAYTPMAAPLFMSPEQDLDFLQLDSICAMLVWEDEIVSACHTTSSWTNLITTLGQAEDDQPIPMSTDYGGSQGTSNICLEEFSGWLKLVKQILPTKVAAIFNPNGIAFGETYNCTCCQRAGTLDTDQRC